jgi:hypothetical protein
VDLEAETLAFQGICLWFGHMVMIGLARNKQLNCSEDLWVIDLVLAMVMKDSWVSCLLSEVHISAELVWNCQRMVVLCAYVRYDVLGLLAMCRCQSRIDFADYC